MKSGSSTLIEWRGWLCAAGWLSLLSAFAFVVGCDPGPLEGPGTDEPAPADQRSEDPEPVAFELDALVSPLEHQPLEYFDLYCARCHGPWGDFYGEGFGGHLTDHGLEEIVAEMAAGPAGAPLKGSALAAQVAFHRSLLADEPFLLFGGLSEGVMSGEVRPGSTVRLVWSGGEVAAEVTGHRWRLDLPERLPAAPRLVAEREGARTELDLQRAAFSHGAARRSVLRP